MNRFVIGGILASIVVALTGGINRLFADRSQTSSLTNRPSTSLQQSDSVASAPASDLGSLPVEQAGQLVRRQSEASAGGISAASNSVFTDQGAGAAPPNGRAIIAPTNTATQGADGTFTTVNPAPGNVIPRTTGTTTFSTTTTTGDISPIQPNLVQPGVQRPGDPDLESIPALW